MIEDVREIEDVIVYTTLPLCSFGATVQTSTTHALFDMVAQFAQAALLEWYVIDPGGT